MGRSSDTALRELSVGHDAPRACQKAPMGGFFELINKRRMQLAPHLWTGSNLEFLQQDRPKKIVALH